jgi:AP2-associated kinase
LRSDPVKLPIPTHKQMLNMEELTRQTQLEPSVSPPNESDDRSPSPERPYQGVGKLIDQWQRKSAEAEASRNAILSKRASLASPKRAGLVPHSGK